MKYIDTLSLLLEEIKKEKEYIEKSAIKTAESIKNGGIIHILGFGHYNILSLEFFFRPGVFACINPIWDFSTSYMDGILKGNFLERIEGYGRVLINNHNLSSEDILYVISYTGRDLIAIDSALEAKKKEVYTIGLINKENSNIPSKHSSKKNLRDVCDLVIFIPGPSNDLLLSLEKDENFRTSPVSTIISSIILHEIFYETACILERMDIIPPLFRLGSDSKEDDINRKLIKIYKDKIKEF